MFLGFITYQNKWNKVNNSKNNLTEEKNEMHKINKTTGNVIELKRSQR